MDGENLSENMGKRGEKESDKDASCGRKLLQVCILYLRQYSTKNGCVIMGASRNGEVIPCGAILRHTRAKKDIFLSATAIRTVKKLFQLWNISQRRDIVCGMTKG